MFKMVGILLILGTCILYGQQMKWRLREHIEQLLGLKEMLLMISGEISYAKTPLGEAFSRISRQAKAPFSSFLKDVSLEMEQGQGKSFSKIWKSQCSQYKSKFLFQADEWKIFEEVGTNFGYLDVQMQLSNIQLYLQQTEQKLLLSQKELGEKQKLWQSLSIMCGLFLIILLI